MERREPQTEPLPGRAQESDIVAFLGRRGPDPYVMERVAELQREVSPEISNLINEVIQDPNAKLKILRLIKEMDERGIGAEGNERVDQIGLTRTNLTQTSKIHNSVENPDSSSSRTLYASRKCTKRDGEESTETYGMVLDMEASLNFDFENREISINVMTGRDFREPELSTTSQTWHFTQDGTYWSNSSPKSKHEVSLPQVNKQRIDNLDAMKSNSQLSLTDIDIFEQAHKVTSTTLGDAVQFISSTAREVKPTPGELAKASTEWN